MKYTILIPYCTLNVPLHTDLYLPIPLVPACTMLWYKLVQVGMLSNIPFHTDLSRWSGYRFIPSYAMVQTSMNSFVP